jgi:hypothetical protein
MEFSSFFANFGHVLITFTSTLAAVVIGLIIIDREDEYENLKQQMNKLIASNEVLMNLQIDTTNKLSELQDQIGRSEVE